MPKLTSLSPMGLVLALPLVFAASVGMAQTDTTEQPAEEQVEEQAPSASDELSLGEEASEGPKVGETYIKDTFGDWSLRCIKRAEGEDPCQLYQLLADSEGSPVMEFTLFRLSGSGAAQAGATVIVPLETSLAAQLTVSIDDTTARRYPFAFCNSIGCYARIGLTQEDVDAFKRGNAATLRVVPIAAQDQTVDVSLSLSGFTAGFDVVSVSSQ